MIQITGVTLVNGTRRRMKETKKTLANAKALEVYRKRIADVMGRRMQHPVSVDFTYKVKED